ncbi:conserved hypothetical protein [Uncinocarpus reesii 1704]|uniref:T6SS Phospholipase effector Tle1-like catalytic domain-containing protein n=1 Tax=Uncinocarpus reesii (strain UAMH 1704) TaxID=336963 RepID=C4JKV2_UNCRE|nr:uncharacterized protein UREG_00167 [Uncinocarpus reesii 1704]EEP75321.1 conserved hypothetical protein [Uncinocarpus reesii 1704]
MSQISDYAPYLPPKTFVLCFDGTGNKFSGTEADSNVLKIFRMLDRNNSRHFHYYQPGIGTYVSTASLSNTGLLSRIKGSYMKAKDSAVGSSFAEHVVGGYRFLMRYYSPGDDIYFFGFSRGAYTARFLAEMLDYVGLLTAGNEELVRFAWKTFSKWQQRSGDSEEHRKEKQKLFRYMKAFRETFSRPVKQIRFLGLFDTVNSVPTFESAWMQRNKFPYTARSSAKVIRHAVGIDERRAKFRQDLISECRHCTVSHYSAAQKYSRWRHRKDKKNGARKFAGNQPNNGTRNGEKSKRNNGDNGCCNKQRPQSPSRTDSYETEDRYRPPVDQRAWKDHNVHLSTHRPGDLDSEIASARSGISQLSFHHDYQTAFEDGAQDIQEVWFPGGHADIGGGWDLRPGEAWPLSHAPLVWMVQEAQKAGLQFDERKLRQFRCDGPYKSRNQIMEVEKPSVVVSDENGAHPCIEDNDDDSLDMAQRIADERFHTALYLSSTQGHLHDCLSFDGSLSAISVLIWKVMEYLPFRRMDLQPDGSWKPIRWPLPCGEVRDIPKDAHIHVSAIRRMKADKNYRPGNLIVGGGGRGVKRAPEHLGIGEWVIVGDQGHVVREIYVRKDSRAAE